MTKSYDKHYQEKNYFGEPYPELIKFFKDLPVRGSLVDLGCGQGRSSIPLAELGYEVTGIDSSSVGIQCMLDEAKSKNLDIKGIVGDIHNIDDFSQYRFILLDSMFHFLKHDRVKETNLVKKIITLSKLKTIFIFCIRDSGNKVKILNQAIDHDRILKRLLDKNIKYKFMVDDIPSEADYKIIAVQK